MKRPERILRTLATAVETVEAIAVAAAVTRRRSLRTRSPVVKFWGKRKGVMGKSEAIAHSRLTFTFYPFISVQPG